MRKDCTKCGKEKDYEEFPVLITHSTGRKPRCVECTREDGRAYASTHKIPNSRQRRKHYVGFREKERARSKRRRVAIAALLIKLKSNPCGDCGKSLPYFCMDFDHRDPTDKIKNIKVIKSCPSKKHIMEEIEKCDLICVNCHRLREVVRKETKGEFYSSSHVVTNRVRGFLVREKSKPCLDCSHSFHPACMDFDHVRGQKIGEVSQLARRFGLERLSGEIRKCDLVCACCHRIRTQGRLLKRAA